MLHQFSRIIRICVVGRDDIMTQLLLGENIIGWVLGFLGPGRRERQRVQRKNKSTTKAKFIYKIENKKKISFYIYIIS